MKGRRGGGRKAASPRRSAPSRPRARRGTRKGRLRSQPLALAIAAGIGLVAGLYLASSPRQQSAALAVEVPEGRVRVEVLNAGGVDGLASEATDYLREIGFDVVYFGNAPTFGQDSTVVVDRVGRADLAGAVAAALGIRNVRSEPDPNLFVDVSVWLGSEWERPLGNAGGAQDGLESPMAWNPGRWLEQWFTDDNP